MHQETESTLDALAREGANLAYEAAFLPRAAADAVLATLLAAVDFDGPEPQRVFVHGRWHAVPRRQVAYGDAGASYRFSGCRVPARPWLPPLLDLRRDITRRTGFDANFVLLNLYRDGADCIGWHSDDEADLGAEPRILSLSLGAVRDFQLRRRVPPSPIRALALGHGSLLDMRHPTNRDWRHQLPRRGGAQPQRIGLRLNLTWRRVGTEGTP